MAYILNIFTLIGFGSTIYFIGKTFDEWKMNRLADESARKLFEERRRERLQAEWFNMTTGGTPALFHPKLGWLLPCKTSEMRGEEGSR
jgi:hypothetical protein